MKKQRTIIFILTGLLLLITAGFAAFSTSLVINGMASITSSWDVEITNIETTSIIGTASESALPIYSNTSATFSTSLISPGDSITYKITIKNKGSLDAIIDKIEITDPNNPYISFEVTGIDKGDKLLKSGSSDTTYAYVKVSYIDYMEGQGQPSSSELNSNLTVKIDYVQTN